MFSRPEQSLEKETTMADKTSTDDFTSIFMKFMKDMKVPTPEMEALTERYRKNLAALDAAARTAGEGAGAILERQREMLKEAMDEIAEMAADLKGGGDPKELMAKQAEFARRSFETAMKNTTEMVSVAQKSGTEAFKMLQGNMQEMVEEMREAMTKASRK